MNLSIALIIIQSAIQIEARMEVQRHKHQSSNIVKSQVEALHHHSVSSTLKRKQSNLSIRSIPPAKSLTERELFLTEEIKNIERKLKDLPYLDLKVEIKDVEDIVQKAVKDLVANVEEHHEIKAMMKQVERELKEIEEKTKSTKKIGLSSRRREGSPATAQDEGSNEQKLAAKITVVKKLQQLKAKNDEQKVMISRFLSNLCRQGKRGELEERVMSNIMNS